MVATKARTRWSAEEIETLRRLYPAQPATKIAAQLGRSVEATHKKIETLGLVVHPRVQVDATFFQAIRDLNAKGCSDREIASRLKCATATVGSHRRKMGLPSNQHHKRQQAKAQAGSRAVLQSRGMSHLCDYHTLAHQQYAQQNGWPADLLPGSVDVLNALDTFGPMTRRELSDAIGKTWKGAHNALECQYSNAKTNHLSVLINRGLVVLLGRLSYGDDGRASCCVYSLSMTAERRFPDVAG